MPHHLAQLALVNKKVFYDLLFYATAETLLEVAADPEHLGAQIGFFAVLAASYYQCRMLSKGLSPSRVVIQKGHYALPVDYSRGPVSCTFGPLCDLIEAKSVLDCWRVDGNHEFSHGPHFRCKFVGAEFCNREGYGLIKRFRLNFNIMRDAISVGERDTAPVHRAIV